ncbi:uncharacterized protein BYT42DRAFT_554876 [Radiomyces spectabilis]|uniref:uncharacterized protein n=1 Tax=Radiomyces spectabilis TaxID=64574 RepID=UPI00221EE898|nr:uncharacterized protein BYT42DRAFT_554876 [Radiomyces spectabilis]KAI8390913.1 hypothetical protein BYT42DRAFT_554876 [Radiomyces spectabilis]
MDTQQSTSARSPQATSLVMRHQSWLDFSLILPNKGSMARDQLANERNWLTGFRLSCTLMILGFTVLLKFRLPAVDSEESGDDSNNLQERARQPFGYLFVCIGICSFLITLRRYFKDQMLLANQRSFVQAGWGSFIMVAVVFVFACVFMVFASIHGDTFSA